MPVLNLLQKNLLMKSKGVTEICEKNRYTLQFLLTMADLRREKAKKELQNKNLSDSECESDDDIPGYAEEMELESKWEDSE